MWRLRGHGWGISQFSKNRAGHDWPNLLCHVVFHHLEHLQLSLEASRVEELPDSDQLHLTGPIQRGWYDLRVLHGLPLWQTWLLYASSRIHDAWVPGLLPDREALELPDWDFSLLETSSAAVLGSRNLSINHSNRLNGQDWLNQGLLCTVNPGSTDPCEDVDGRHTSEVALCCHIICLPTHSDTGNRSFLPSQS